MQQYLRIPLLFLFLASVLGLILRWQFISPLALNYSFVLHGHSHCMFLGWVFNTLYLAFTLNHIPPDQHKNFKNIFIFLQGLTIGMFIAFPLQGYGLYSIIFSSIHTLISLLFIVFFLQKTKTLTSASIWFARASLVFFIISTAGPFSLSYIMAGKLGHTNWYFYSIYYYLHFQYNGFFLFGIVSLFFHQLEKRRKEFNQEEIKNIGKWLFVATIPAYLLSTLWANPGWIYNAVACIGAIIQCYSFYLLLRWINHHIALIKASFENYIHPYLIIVLIIFGIKLLLQLLSAHPIIAELAYQLRPLIIAYLHLVLLGIITLYLIIWYFESGYLLINRKKTLLFSFTLSFAVMEIILILTPWWSTLIKIPIPPHPSLLFFSLLLSGCFLFLALQSRFKKT
jgi:hypothetical protein